jgi:hypothetical protein
MNTFAELKTWAGKDSIGNYGSEIIMNILFEMNDGFIIFRNILLIILGNGRKIGFLGGMVVMVMGGMGDKFGIYIGCGLGEHIGSPLLGEKMGHLL